MGSVNSSRINQLHHYLPEGVLVAAGTLKAKGYSDQLLKKYRDSGWLLSPAHGVYRRPGPPLKWQHVVYSLARMLERSLHVGGFSALELRGYAHFVKPRGPTRIHVYCDARLPGWVSKLELPEKLVVHGNRLFDVGSEGGRRSPSLQGSITTERWGAWDWELPFSTPERAILEFLDEVPARESFEHADSLIAGLAELSSRRLLKLLSVCTSVKVKRLFLALASRHDHTWTKSVIESADRGEIDVGKGKRSLVKGGWLHPKYLVTLPESLHVPR